MAVIVWTTRARADLEEIADYHASRSPAYAEALVRGLLGAVGRLEAFPRSGRAVPELADAGFREVLYRDHRIVYLYDDAEDRVDVLSVFHTSRSLG